MWDQEKWGRPGDACPWGGRRTGMAAEMGPAQALCQICRLLPPQTPATEPNGGRVSAGANYNKTINSGGHLCSCRAPDVLRFRPISGGRKGPGGRPRDRPGPLDWEGRGEAEPGPPPADQARFHHSRQLRTLGAASHLLTRPPWSLWAFSSRHCGKERSP